MRAVAALALGACLAFAIACGGMSRKAAMAPPAGVDGGGGALGHDPRIVELDRTIDDELRRLEIARPVAPPIAPGCEPGCIQPLSVTAAGDAQCHPAPNTVCKQSCEVADAICDASNKICTIAGELGNDAWANERCASGKASCEAAHGKCCGCT